MTMFRLSTPSFDYNDAATRRDAQKKCRAGAAGGPYQHSKEGEPSTSDSERHKVI
jgi:hypothetical protein